MQTENVESQGADVPVLAPDRPERKSTRHILGEGASRFGLLAAWAALIVGFGLAAPQTFFSSANIDSILSIGAIFVILTIGVLPSLSAGELDLSIGGVLGLSMVMTAYADVNLHLPLAVAIAMALGVGLATGLVNAFLIIVLGIDSLIVTLGMGTLLAGIALAVTAQPISGVSSVLVNIATHTIFGVQLAVFYAAALVAIMWYVVRYTALGQFILFAGAGRTVAKLSGVRVNAIRAQTLIFASLVASVAGVLAAGTAGASDPTVGPSYLLPAFAAAFLGSTAITPGRFNAIGTFCAVYFLQTGVAGLELLGLSGWVDQVFYGGSLIVAVALPRLIGARVAGLSDD
ncbi:MAG TPA: ABC transporter permease [Solirubrobacteraceae bacterium]|jgi:ribose transport system permease protein|nr:ABC transporter permease [Solirubrobacteraceae bacterium]